MKLIKGFTDVSKVDVDIDDFLRKLSKNRDAALKFLDLMTETMDVILKAKKDHFRGISTPEELVKRLTETIPNMSAFQITQFLKQYYTKALKKGRIISHGIINNDHSDMRNNAISNTNDDEDMLYKEDDMDMKRDLGVATRGDKKRDLGDTKRGNTISAEDNTKIVRGIRRIRSHLHYKLRSLTNVFRKLARVLRTKNHETRKRYIKLMRQILHAILKAERQNLRGLLTPDELVQKLNESIPNANAFQTVEHLNEYYTKALTDSNTVVDLGSDTVGDMTNDAVGNLNSNSVGDMDSNRLGNMDSDTVGDVGDMDSDRIGNVGDMDSNRIGNVGDMDSNRFGDVDDMDSKRIGNVGDMDSKRIGNVGDMDSKRIGNVGDMDSKRIGNVGDMDSKRIGNVGDMDSNRIGNVGDMDSKRIGNVGDMDSKRIGNMDSNRFGDVGDMDSNRIGNVGDMDSKRIGNVGDMDSNRIGDMDSNNVGDMDSNTVGDMDSDTDKVYIPDSRDEGVAKRAIGTNRVYPVQDELYRAYVNDMGHNTLGDLNRNTLGNMDSNTVGDLASDAEGDMDSNTVGDMDSNNAGDMDSNTVRNMDSNTDEVYIPDSRDEGIVKRAIGTNRLNRVYPVQDVDDDGIQNSYRAYVNDMGRNTLGDLNRNILGNMDSNTVGDLASDAVGDNMKSNTVGDLANDAVGDLNSNTIGNNFYIPDSTDEGGRDVAKRASSRIRYDSKLNLRDIEVVEGLQLPNDGQDKIKETSEELNEINPSQISSLDANSFPPSSLDLETLQEANPSQISSLDANSYPPSSLDLETLQEANPSQISSLDLQEANPSQTSSLVNEAANIINAANNVNQIGNRLNDFGSDVQDTIFPGSSSAAPISNQSTLITVTLFSLLTILVYLYI